MLYWRSISLQVQNSPANNLLTAEMTSRNSRRRDHHHCSPSRTNRCGTLHLDLATTSTVVWSFLLGHLNVKRTHQLQSVLFHGGNNVAPSLVWFLSSDLERRNAAVTKVKDFKCYTGPLREGSKRRRKQSGGSCFHSLWKQHHVTEREGSRHEFSSQMHHRSTRRIEFATAFTILWSIVASASQRVEAPARARPRGLSTRALSRNSSSELFLCVFLQYLRDKSCPQLLLSILRTLTRVASLFSHKKSHKATIRIIC